MSLYSREFIHMYLHRTYYIITIFLSAFLLFLIQPMIAKMILPQLGGSPSVWQTVMLFFQSLLLLGYAYVTFTSQKMSFKTQKILHLILTALAVICLPLALYTHEIVDRSNEPIIWLFISLTLTIGLPFFILSANAPLLQRWFSLSPDPNAENPYFLYSASNVGSLLALLAYPFVIEPYITLSGQANIWSLAYLIFFCCLLFLGLKTRYNVTPKVKIEAITKNSSAPSLKTQIYWGFLSFIPSSLMLGVTNYITTDVASFPLLWILPLALYLITFILVFAKGMPLYNLCYQLAPAAIMLPFLVTYFTLDFHFLGNYIYSIIPYLISFFIIAMMVHGRLSLSRPKAEYLTYFYMWMSIGGALGGVFNALIAPVVFNSVIEYKLILALSAFAMGPISWKLTKSFFKDIFSATSIIFLMAIAWVYLDTDEGYAMAAVIVVMLISNHVNINTRHVIFSIIAVTIANPAFIFYENIRDVIKYDADLTSIMHDESIIFQERNFFGVSVVEHDTDIDAYKYYHGTTLHGGQFRDPEYALAAVSYYSHMLTEFKDALPTTFTQSPIGITGLGVGTLSCFANEEQEVDIFEIDPAVIKIASDQNQFTYLSDCPGTKKLILGDARLKLINIPDNRYGILFLDAYSSDALPMHLLTDEAFQLYLAKIQDNGILAFNISNRYVDIAPVLASFADKYNLTAYIRFATFEDDPENMINASKWVIMSRSENSLPNQTFLKEFSWKPLDMSQQLYWSDNFSSILSAMD